MAICYAAQVGSGSLPVPDMLFIDGALGPEGFIFSFSLLASAKQNEFLACLITA